MQKTFDTPGPTSLYVEIGAGELRVDAADVAETTVEVTGDQAEDTTVEQRGDQVVVVAPQRRAGLFGRTPELDVRVTMPTASRLATKLGSADTTVTGRVGETLLKSGSGDIRMETVDAEAMFEVGSGRMSVGEVTGDLRVKAGSGDLTLERSGGSVSVATGSGDVEITSAVGAVQVKTGSGDLRVREAHSDVSLSTASGDVVVDLMHAGELVAKNVSGDVRVGVPAGLPVWTDIVTVTGSVHSDLEGAGQPGEGEPFLALRAKTVSGDIHLAQR